MLNRRERTVVKLLREGSANLRNGIRGPDTLEWSDEELRRLEDFSREVEGLHVLSPESPFLSDDEWSLLRLLARFQYPMRFDELVRIDQTEDRVLIRAAGMLAAILADRGFLLARRR
jgi:hypothetical protein